jgi:cAMP-dependent protein kinase regulator
MALDREKLRQKAEMHVKEGLLAQALEDYMTLLILEAKNPDINERIAEICLKLGDKTKAIGEYKKAIAKLERTGDSETRLKLCEKVLELDPGQSDIEELMNHLNLEAVAHPHLDTAPKAQRPDTPFFSDLSEEEFNLIMDKSNKSTVLAGRTIIQDGDTGDSVYFIMNGGVGIYKRNLGGEEIMLASLSEGDFFGEFGFFAQAKRQATVRTMVDTEVIELSKEALSEVIEKYPRVSGILVEFYKKRVLDTLVAISPLFSPLDAPKRAELTEKFRLMVVRAGQEVIREGDPGDSLFVIKSGEVEVTTVDNSGRRIELAVLKEGNFFGEAAVVTGMPRTATVTSLTECRLMKLMKSDFDAIARKYPAIVDVAKKYIEQRAQNTITSILEVDKKGEAGMV